MDLKQIAESKTLLRELRILTKEQKVNRPFVIHLLSKDEKALQKLYRESIERKLTGIKKRLRVIGFTGDYYYDD